MGLGRIATAGVLLLLLVLPAAPAPAVGPITPVTPPSITGPATYGATLSAASGTWSPTPVAYAYQWLRDGAPVRGATGAAYALGVEDLGTRLSVRVDVADETGGTGTTVSAPTEPVSRAVNPVTRTPGIRGALRFGRTVRATAAGFALRPAAVRWQWLRGITPIPGATDASYAIQAADVGARLRVQASASAPGLVDAVATSTDRARVGHRRDLRRTVTYHVETRGRIATSVREFATQAQQTYADARGWRGAGVGFRQVPTGGDFTLVLAAAGEVPRFSSACSSTYSCRVGRFVVINQDRWRRATPSWNAAGGSLRDYRHLVVDHETGHWLGLGHAGCPGRGVPAPVMMQQSKGLAGCRFNPWPTLGELGRV